MNKGSKKLSSNKLAKPTALVNKNPRISKKKAFDFLQIPLHVQKITVWCTDCFIGLYFLKILFEMLFGAAIECNVFQKDGVICITAS